MTEFGAFDAKVASLDAELTSEIGVLRRDLDARLHRSLQRTLATTVALATVMTAVVMIFR